MYRFFGIFIYLVVCVVAQKEHKQRVNITVYYETLCPHARNFTVNQLHPILQGNLSRYVNLELIPYGKTNRTSDINSNVTFTCQHGPAECYGNLIQGCSRDLIDYGNNSDKLGFNKNHLDFVQCFMKNLTTKSTMNEVEKAVHKCAKPKIIPALRLKSCANNTFGIQHLIQYGKLTDRFEQPLKHVPTIVFNGFYNKEESDGAQEDLLSEICSKIRNPKPKECNGVKIQQRNNFTSGVYSIHAIPTFFVLYPIILIVKNIFS